MIDDPGAARDRDPCACSSWPASAPCSTCCLLITTLVLLYFDLRRYALGTCLLFLVLNGTLAGLTMETGVETYGLGYALSSLIALTTAVLLLAKGLRELDFMTFTSQPKKLEST